jgi:hypothetical protein
METIKLILSYRPRVSLSTGANQVKTWSTNHEVLRATCLAGAGAGAGAGASMCSVASNRAFVLRSSLEPPHIPWLLALAPFQDRVQ